MIFIIDPSYLIVQNKIQLAKDIGTLVSTFERNPVLYHLARQVISLINTLVLCLIIGFYSLKHFYYNKRLC